MQKKRKEKSFHVLCIFSLSLSLYLYKHKYRRDDEGWIERERYHFLEAFGDFFFVVVVVLYFSMLSSQENIKRDVEIHCMFCVCMCACDWMSIDPTNTYNTIQYNVYMTVVYIKFEGSTFFV